MARWLESLSEFDFIIEHRIGSKHGNADGFSRILCENCKQCNQIERREGGPSHQEIKNMDHDLAICDDIRLTDNSGSAGSTQTHVILPASSHKLATLTEKYMTINTTTCHVPRPQSLVHAVTLVAHKGSCIITKTYPVLSWLNYNNKCLVILASFMTV